MEWRSTSRRLAPAPLSFSCFLAALVRNFFLYTFLRDKILERRRRHFLTQVPLYTGTSRTDYAPQLEQLSKSKYTLIAWDPPGYGFSRPPQRVYKGVQTFHSDAELAAELMQVC